MDYLMLILDLGRKTLLGILAAFGVWLAVSIPTALAVGRIIARADADLPVVCDDADDPTYPTPGA